MFLGSANSTRAFLLTSSVSLIPLSVRPLLKFRLAMAHHFSLTHPDILLGTDSLIFHFYRVNHPRKSFLMFAFYKKISHRFFLQLL